MIHELALVTFFLRTISNSDCQWHNAIEFWSNVVCSIENVKTVNFHGVFDSGRSSIFLDQCFQTFVKDITHKCQATIASKIYMLRDSENLTSFITNNDIIQRVVERPSICKITSGGKIPSRAIKSLIARRTRIRSGRVSGKNTWNVHVILARDIHSFHQISKDASTFPWNPHDRFIALIALPEENNSLSNPELDDILKTLWFKRKVQKILVSNVILVNDTIQINQTVHTYNPFAKVNDSVWGKVEIITVKTVKEASNVLSRLTYHRTKNMNGYELKVGYFKQGQTMAKPIISRSNLHYNYADVFKGFDEIMLNTIAQDMNFKVTHIHPTDNKSYGHQLPNGTYVGAIAYTGDVVHGRTDICFVSFFVKKYSTKLKEDIEFTTYVDFDRLCVVVPKATKIPKGIRIYHFFPLSIWICSMLTHVFTYLTWYFLQVFTPKRTGRISFRTTIYRSFLLNAGCPQKLPNTSAERILLSGILLANVTLVGIFGGILYNSFAHDMYYPDIHNLHDLDVSGLPILLTSISLTDLFGCNNNVDSTPLMENLRKKLQYGPHAVSIAAHHRNVSALARERYFPIINEELFDVDGPLLHLVEECPGKFYLSYLLPKNSILNEKINALINQLNQAGLPSLWNQHIIHAFIVQKRLLTKEKLARDGKEIDGFVPFNLSDMQSSFYMLLIGLLISTIVFFHEKGWLKVSLLH
ncbi:hypothetical protein P5V15_009219 [Pogonomyrmex californicus]